VPRITVAIGVANIPSGSQAATPILTDPTSTASLLPDLNLVSKQLQPGCGMVSRYATHAADVGNSGLNRTKC